MTKPLPKVVRFYITHCVIGFGLAAVFTGLIIGFNVANIGHLVTHVQGGWLAAFVFFMLNGIVFAGVQTGISVWLMADDEAAPPKGPSAPVALPVSIPVDRPRR